MCSLWWLTFPWDLSKLHRSVVCSFLSLNSILLCVCNTIYQFTCWRTCRLFLVFGYWKYCNKVEILIFTYVFYFSGRNAYECECRVIWWENVQFYKKLPNFCIVSVPFCIPIRNICKIQFICILINIWYCHFFLMLIILIGV